MTGMPGRYCQATPPPHCSTGTNAIVLLQGRVGQLTGSPLCAGLIKCPSDVFILHATLLMHIFYFNNSGSVLSDVLTIHNIEMIPIKVWPLNELLSVDMKVFKLCVFMSFFLNQGKQKSHQSIQTTNFVGLSTEMSCFSKLPTDLLILEKKQPIFRLNMYGQANIWNIIKIDALECIISHAFLQ